MLEDRSFAITRKAQRVSWSRITGDRPLCTIMDAACVMMLPHPPRTTSSSPHQQAMSPLPPGAVHVDLSTVLPETAFPFQSFCTVDVGYRPASKTHSGGGGTNIVAPTPPATQPQPNKAASPKGIAGLASTAALHSPSAQLIVGVTALGGLAVVQLTAMLATGGGLRGTCVLLLDPPTSSSTRPACGEGREPVAGGEPLSVVVDVASSSSVRGSNETPAMVLRVLWSSLLHDPAVLSLAEAPIALEVLPTPSSSSAIVARCVSTPSVMWFATTDSIFTDGIGQVHKSCVERVWAVQWCEHTMDYTDERPCFAVTVDHHGSVPVDPTRRTLALGMILVKGTAQLPKKQPPTQTNKADGAASLVMREWAALPSSTSFAEGPWCVELSTIACPQMLLHAAVPVSVTLGGATAGASTTLVGGGAQEYDDVFAVVQLVPSTISAPSTGGFGVTSGQPYAHGGGLVSGTTSASVRLLRPHAANTHEGLAPLGSPSSPFASVFALPSVSGAPPTSQLVVYGGRGVVGSCSVKGCVVSAACIRRHRGPMEGEVVALQVCCVVDESNNHNEADSPITAYLFTVTLQQQQQRGGKLASMRRPSSSSSSSAVQQRLDSGGIATTLPPSLYLSIVSQLVSVPALSLVAPTAGRHQQEQQRRRPLAAFLVGCENSSGGPTTSPESAEVSVVAGVVGYSNTPTTDVLCLVLVPQQRRHHQQEASQLAAADDDTLVLDVKESCSLLNNILLGSRRDCHARTVSCEVDPFRSGNSGKIKLSIDISVFGVVHMTFTSLSSWALTSALPHTVRADLWRCQRSAAIGDDWPRFSKEKYLATCAWFPGAAYGSAAEAAAPSSHHATLPSGTVVLTILNNSEASAAGMTVLQTVLMQTPEYPVASIASSSLGIAPGKLGHTLPLSAFHCAGGDPDQVAGGGAPPPKLLPIQMVHLLSKAPHGNTADATPRQHSMWDDAFASQPVVWWTLLSCTNVVGNAIFFLVQGAIEQGDEPFAPASALAAKQHPPPLLRCCSRLVDAFRGFVDCVPRFVWIPTPNNNTANNRMDDAGGEGSEKGMILFCAESSLQSLVVTTAVPRGGTVVSGGSAGATVVREGLFGAWTLSFQRPPALHVVQQHTSPHDKAEEFTNTLPAVPFTMPVVQQLCAIPAPDGDDGDDAHNEQVGDGGPLLRLFDVAGRPTLWSRAHSCEYATVTRVEWLSDTMARGAPSSSTTAPHHVVVLFEFSSGSSAVVVLTRPLGGSSLPWDADVTRFSCLRTLWRDNLQSTGRGDGGAGSPLCRWGCSFPPSSDADVTHRLHLVSRPNGVAACCGCSNAADDQSQRRTVVAERSLVTNIASGGASKPHQQLASVLAAVLRAGGGGGGKAGRHDSSVNVQRKAQDYTHPASSWVSRPTV